MFPILFNLVALTFAIASMIYFVMHLRQAQNWQFTYGWAFAALSFTLLVFGYMAK